MISSLSEKVISIGQVFYDLTTTNITNRSDCKYDWLYISQNFSSRKRLMQSISWKALSSTKISYLILIRSDLYISTDWVKIQISLCERNFSEMYHEVFRNIYQNPFWESISKSDSATRVEVIYYNYYWNWWFSKYVSKIYLKCFLLRVAMFTPLKNTKWTPGFKIVAVKSHVKALLRLAYILSNYIDVDQNVLSLCFELLPKMLKKSKYSVNSEAKSALYSFKAWHV